MKTRPRKPWPGPTEVWLLVDGKCRTVWQEWFHDEVSAECAMQAGYVDREYDWTPMRYAPAKPKPRRKK